MDTTYCVDRQFDQTLEKLREHYGETSKAEVLRMAVALLNIVSRNENPDGNVVIRRDANDLTVVLR